MKEEVQNLEKCATGVAMREHEIKAIKGRFPSPRVIGCRWVAAFKSSNRVRCRIVAKGLARGTSAKSLGYSSPTPSVEALHLLLVLAANRNYHVASIDISHAFMHSPLPPQEKVALSMPLSVSHEDGEPLYLLRKSLNGLRNTSLDGFVIIYDPQHWSMVGPDRTWCNLCICRLCHGTQLRPVCWLRNGYGLCE